MLFWLIVAVCVIIAFIGCISERNIWPVLPIGALGGLVLGVFIGISSLIVGNNFTPTRTEEWFIELVSLRNGPEHISGSFFLGSGTFGNTEMYVYMYRTKNGDIRRGRENAYRCTIRETDKQTPRRTYDKRFMKVPWLLPWEIQAGDSMAAFVVPPGTVISLDQYEID